MLAPAPRAMAQGTSLLPSDAADVNLGDLRQRYDSMLAPTPETPVQGFTVTPSINISGFFADPAQPQLGTNSSKGADVGTIINPNLLINGQTNRLQATFAYSPQAILYAHDGSGNSIAQNFNANLHATLVPETLFLDARGYGSMVLGQGGYGGGGYGFSPQQLTQTYAFQISPLLQHRFDGTGVAELGYTFADTIFDNGTNTPQVTPFSTVAPNQNQITNSAHVGFQSGENYGRVKFGGLLSTAQSTGGDLGASHRNEATVNLAYGVTRAFILVGTLGYEDLHYGGTTPYNTTGMTWSVGTRVLPNPKSQLELTYGHRDGGNSFAFNGTYQIGPRLVLTGRYSKGIATAADDLQSALGSSRLDPFGNPIDAVTGVPIMLEDNFFGTFATVDRIERYSASLAYVLDRDVFTLATRTDHDRVLSAPSSIVGGPNSTSSSYASLAWQHDLSEVVTTNASYQYGVRNGTGSTAVPGTATEYINSFSVGAQWRLSKTLSTSAQYALDVTSSKTPGYSETTHYAVITLSKQF